MEDLGYYYSNPESSDDQGLSMGYVPTRVKSASLVASLSAPH